MYGVKKAKLFGLFFDKLPTYDKLDSRTPLNSISQGLNPVFSLNYSKHHAWQGRQDSNLRPSVLETDALAN